MAKAAYAILPDAVAGFLHAQERPRLFLTCCAPRSDRVIYLSTVSTSARSRVAETLAALP
jgi:hypothetical protein